MGNERWSVLLVDDTIELRLLMRLILEKTGRFEVVGNAENGSEGVALAEALQPDLIVLDINMPVMDGTEALPLIRQASPHSRIVIFSGIEGETAKWGQAGVSRFIVKGTPTSEIVEGINELMEAS